MKVRLMRGSGQRVTFDIVPDDAVVQPTDIVMNIDDFPVGEMPAIWAEKRVWPEGEAAPRLVTPSEDLQQAKSEAAASVRAASETTAYSSLELRVARGRWARPQVQLTPREQALLNAEDARYVRLTEKLDAIDAATTPQAARAVAW